MQAAAADCRACAADLGLCMGCRWKPLDREFLLQVSYLLKDSLLHFRSPLLPFSIVIYTYLYLYICVSVYKQSIYFRLL